MQDSIFENMMAETKDLQKHGIYFITLEFTQERSHLSVKNVERNLHRIQT